MSFPTRIRQRKKEVKARMEGSWGATEWETVELTFSVWIPELVTSKDERSRGGFEISGGRYHDGGGLWFKGNELYDYDGVCSLSSEIMDILEENGFDVEDMRRCHE
tara:strand:- start:1960 stop:2277 length:318 start_codon:yes stop_codon:yes gene_type:complete